MTRLLFFGPECFSFTVVEFSFTFTLRTRGREITYRMYIFIISVSPRLKVRSTPGIFRIITIVIC